MKYSDLRKSFAKCGLSVTERGISLVFPRYDPERWITQSIDDEDFKNKGIFVSLLNGCDSVSLSIHPGNSTFFSFNMKMALEADLVFQPLKPEMSHEELENLFVKLANNGEYSEEFLDVFKDVDLYDQDSVIEGFEEVSWLKKQTVPYNLQGKMRWESIVKSARNFADSCGFGIYSATPPGQELDFGFVDFYFDCKKDAVYNIPREIMPKFIEMIQAANSISLENQSSTGETHFVLSVFS